MHHFGRFIQAPITRREMLAGCANGFGARALAALMADETEGQSPQGADHRPGLHHAARVKRVVFLYMDGGPSQVDTFDYKPLLDKHHGRDPHTVFKVEPTQ